MKLRLMTWNVHRCVGVDKRLDVERCARVIAAAKPDIVGLQELDVGRKRTGHVDQAHRLGELLSMRSHFNAAMHIEEERYGDALLTTLPERLVRAGPLPGYPKIKALEPRGAVWIAVTLPDGQELQVINTHLGLIPQEQKKQATALVADWMADEAFSAPGILMGDFNATPFQEPYRIISRTIADAQLQWPGPPMSTYPSGFPFMRIDHVFVSPGIKVTRVESPFDPEARKASDHLPLVIEVEIPPRGAASPPKPA